MRKKIIYTIVTALVAISPGCKEDAAGNDSSINKKTRTVTTSQIQKKLNQVKDDIVVINYWATWCKPCLAELAELDAIQQQFADKGVHVFTVNVDLTEDEVNKALIDYHYDRLRHIRHSYTSVSETKEIMSILETEWVEVVPVTYVATNKLKKIKRFIGRASLKDMKAYLTSLEGS